MGNGIIYLKLDLPSRKAKTSVHESQVSIPTVPKLHILLYSTD